MREQRCLRRANEDQGSTEARARPYPHAAELRLGWRYRGAVGCRAVGWSGKARPYSNPQHGIFPIRDVRVFRRRSVEPGMWAPDCGGMRTFDACVSPRSLGLAIVLPPVLFFLTVQLVDSAMLRGVLGLEGLVLLIALAQILPLAALAWILVSTAAYSVGSGKVIVHRVISDRELPLPDAAEPPRLNKGIITYRVRPNRRISLRVERPHECLRLLRSASASQPALPT
jgi:hypothetical protein